MSESPSRMVERVVLILSVFERNAGALTLGQICTRSGLPRSSVHRILQHLVNARWLQRADNQYTLGLRMFEIGSQVAHRRISDAAKPFVQDLAAKTGHVVHLAVLDRQDVVYLEKVGGALASELPSRIGGRLPAHCTAVGKVLLAYAPPSAVERFFDSGLRGRTSASIKTPEALRVALIKIRNAGYAIESDEAVPGVACVAAPIFEHGDVVAALSVCGHRKLVRAEELKHRVMWTAAEVSRRLSMTSRPGPAAHAPLLTAGRAV